MGTRAADLGPCTGRPLALCSLPRWARFRLQPGAHSERHRTGCTAEPDPSRSRVREARRGAQRWLRGLCHGAPDRFTALPGSREEEGRTPRTRSRRKQGENQEGARVLQRGWRAQSAPELRISENSARNWSPEAGLDHQEPGGLSRVKGPRNVEGNPPGEGEHNPSGRDRNFKKLHRAQRRENSTLKRDAREE